MDFIKAHGTLNDFVVLVDLDDQITLNEAFVQAVCHRRGGIGADAVIRIGASQTGDAFMDYRNADGSLSEMCGNGVRVTADQLVRAGAAGDGEIAIDTRDGIKTVEPRGTDADGNPTYRVNMGPAIVDDERIVTAGTHELTGRAVRTGNPHFVSVVESIRGPLLEQAGAALQSHPDFPERVNLELVMVDPDVGDMPRVQMRVYERGVGETWACGTASTAVAGVVGPDLGERFELVCKGGLHIMEYAGDGKDIHMVGNAVEVFRARLPEAFAALLND